MPTPAEARAGAISAQDFAAVLERLGPFEREPEIAAAVSGGRDSMALVVLLRDWSRTHGGRLTGLIVDHRLRPGSGLEAARTARILGRLGVRSAVLEITGPQPRSALQEFARSERYRLLEQYCAERDILHLFTGHHAADQRETVEMRGQRGTGLVGGAGMSAVRETDWLRILRPLLGFERKRLAATLEAHRVGWFDDPSNADRRFERVRVREALLAAPASGFERPALARQALEQATGRWLARHLRLHPAGFADLSARALAGVVPDVAVLALGAVLRTIAGTVHPPRHDAIARLHEAMREPGWNGATLGGVRMTPRTGMVRFSREVSTVSPGTARSAKGERRFDNRFAIGPADPMVDLPVAALGARGWARLGRHAREAWHRWGGRAYEAWSMPAAGDLDDPRDKLHQETYPDGCVSANVRFHPRRPLLCASFVQGIVV